MLSLLIDLDENLDAALQPQPRQARREAIREKRREKEKRKAEAKRIANSLPPRPTKAEFAKIRKRQKQNEKERLFTEHCYDAANKIVRAADDIERHADDTDKWHEGIEALITTLATKHNVVNGNRLLHEAVSKYEHDVISGALELCRFDKLLHIERKLGWLRLHVLDTTGYYGVGRSLRTA